VIETFKGIWQILDNKKKSQFFGLFFLMFIGSILEIMSIGMILPVLTFLSQDLNNIGSKYFSILFEPLLVFSKKDLIKYSIIIFCSIFLLRSFFILFLAWIQNNYIYGWKVNLSNEVFKKYMNLPYIFHLRNNSAELNRNVVIEVDKCVGVFNNVLFLILEILVLVGVVSLLLFISWQITLSIFFLLAILSLLFSFSVKNKIKKVGHQRFISEGHRLQYLKQGFNGIKDIKIYGKVSEFIKQFSKANKENQQAYQTYLILQKIPRFLTESSVVLFICITIFVLSTQNMQFTSIIPIIGIFVLAAIRLIPASNKIISFYNAIKYDKPSLNSISKIFQLKNNTLEANTNYNFNQQISFKNKIELRNICYTYSNKTNFSLNNINLEIGLGDYIAFVGNSGSGKTTLADILLGLLEPNSGEIVVDGKNIKLNLSSWQKNIGYVPQQIYLTDDTLRNNIAYGINTNKIDDKIIDEVIEKSQLSDLINKLPKGLNTFVGEFGKNLSGGERQRIGIARALYRNPKLLFLDESTNSLDEKTEEQIFSIMESFKKEKTIILITHKESLTKNANKVFKFLEGSVKKIK
tara:strand:- start:5749 stop:7482 length:1734 start_codon:yes stop_codon:yes gene_type:complete